MPFPPIRHPRPGGVRPLDVSLDPSGRPYDRPFPRGATIERRRLITLHAPSRRVVVAGGESLPYLTAGEYEPLTLAERPNSSYPIDAIWMHRSRGDMEAIVGVVLVERDTEVVRWAQLQAAGYGTDAGLGGITTLEWTGKEKRVPNELTRLYDWVLVVQGRPWASADVDGTPGVDTLFFSNGFGDGGFPGIAGYDRAGRRVEIVLWTVVAPWRVAFPVGEPPRQVTERENDLAACLAGRRTVDGGLRCRRLP